MLITVPWISSDWSTDTVYIIIGVSLAILMIGKFILICTDEVHIFREGLKTLKKNLRIPPNKLPGQKSFKLLVGILGETMTS